jgi:hypothetical protein
LGKGAGEDYSEGHMRFTFGILVLSVIAHLTLLAWAERAFPAWSRSKLRTAAAISCVLVPALRILARSMPVPGLSWLAAMLIFGLVILITGALFQLPMLGLVTLMSRLVGWPRRMRVQPERATEGAPTEGASPEETPRDDTPELADTAEQPGRRELLVRASGALAYGVPAVLLGWGAAVGRHDYRVEELVVKLPRLPKALDGYTFAQISDIHVGLFVGDDELQRGVELINGLRVDALVMTGDLIDNDAAYAEVLARNLRKVKTRDGVFGIVGNHDHYAGAEEVIDTLRRGGVNMLFNQRHVLRESEGGIVLVGVDDMTGSFHGSGPDYYGALKGLRSEGPRVLLAHQPNYIEWVYGAPDIQLSGHTHGGQINPGFRPADWLFRRVAGRYSEGGTTLYVNRGFGVAGPPSRIGSPPEITKVVLVSG